MSPIRKELKASQQKSDLQHLSNKYLKTALYHAGRTAGHSNSQNFSVFFNRIANRGSRQKAVIVTGHKILRIIYKLLNTDMLYYDENGGNKKGSLATYNS